MTIAWGGEEGGDVCALWQLLSCIRDGAFSFASFVV